MTGVEWWPVAGALTVLGLVLTVLLWRKRGAGAGMKALGASFMPGAIVLVGLQGVLKELWKALANFVTGLLFSPQIWVGLAMAAIGVGCYFVGNRLTMRKLKQGGGSSTTGGSTSGSGSKAPAAPKQVAAKNPKEPTGLEGMEDIDEILKRRGIS